LAYDKIVAQFLWGFVLVTNDISDGSVLMGFCPCD